jgi:hypothetical protein
MSDAYVVVVKGNLVCAIARSSRPREIPMPRSPLEVGTSLAANFRKTGDIDGQYFFDDAPTARTFAGLCLQFTKGLVERRIRVIDMLPKDFEAYHCDEQPTPDAGG